MSRFARSLSAETRKRHRLVERVSAIAQANLLYRHGTQPQLAFVKAFHQRVEMRGSDDAESIIHAVFPPGRIVRFPFAPWHSTRHPPRRSPAR